MRPFAFTSARSGRVTVNPAVVGRVEMRSEPRTDKPHAVRLVLVGQADGEGLSAMTVAEFDEREVAERISERIGEHLWSDDAPALSDDERSLIDANQAVHDDAFAAGRTSTPAEQSKHPALVAQRRLDAADAGQDAKERNRRLAAAGRAMRGRDDR